MQVVSLGEQEDLKPTAMDNCIEVFVSAVATPGTAWFCPGPDIWYLVFREVLGAEDWTSFSWPGQTDPGLNIWEI